MNKLQIGKMPQLPFEVSEAINQLRINLSFCGSDVKTIMITSSTPNEGKSFVTMQLWRMIAELGTPAVLIDCDFRKSEMRSKYGMSTSGQLIGGVHYLAGKAELDDVIYETNVPNGYIIPVAKTVTNPTILLESERFAQMIEHCRQRFGVVLIDTPPLGSVADAMNIATHCDGTVLVVRGGETPRKVVGDSVQQLKRTGVPLLGVVLDRAEMNSKSSLYYKRYYKSGYYYRDTAARDRSLSRNKYGGNRYEKEIRSSSRRCGDGSCHERFCFRSRRREGAQHHRRRHRPCQRNFCSSV